MTTPNLAHETPEPKAFIRDDFEFFSSSGQRLYDLPPDLVPSVDYVRIRWRFRKNADNGQEIPFKRDYERPDVCPVLAAIRIYLRALALKVPPTTPLAVFSLGSSTLHSASSRPVTSSRSYAALRRLPSTFAQTINRWTAGLLIPSVLRLQIFFTVPECQILTSKHVFAGRVTPFLCIFAIHSTQPTSTLRP